MVYLTLEEYFEFIFNDIRELVYDDKAKPAYENETAGIGQLSGILAFIQNDSLYPNLFSKGAFLFVALSTGHKFSNGNKRLALFSYIYFSRRNKISYRSLPIKTYKKWFKIHFPNYKLPPNEFKTNIGWALFNFNKCINIKETEQASGHQYGFDELKKIAEDFFKFISK